MWGGGGMSLSCREDVYFKGGLYFRRGYITVQGCILSGGGLYFRSGILLFRGAYFLGGGEFL